MFAERKRRHISYIWSLPLLVAIMFLAVAKLAALEKADLIAELAHQVAHSDTDDAMSAVRNLAAMPRPPIALLVAAAASPDLKVAEEAQLAIDRYLRVCQRDIKANRRIKVVAAQLAALAESLDRQRSSFSVGDYPWVERTTQTVLRLTNQVPARTSPHVAAHCDSILAAITADASQDQNSAPTSAHSSNRPAIGQSASPVAARGSPDPATEADKLRRQRQLAVMARRSWAEDMAALRAPAPANRATSPLVNHPLATAAVGVPAIPQSASFPPQPVSGAVVRGTPTHETPANELPNTRFDSSWRAKWAHPLFHSLPAMPINAAPISKPNGSATDSILRLAPQDSGRPTDATDSGRQFQEVESRKLLERWLVAEGAEVYPLEQELTMRGFGRLSDRLVQQLFSDQVDDRLRLVDDVLTEPGVDARPWLMLMADDSDADVRLVVVTILATSRDPALIEKAWQVAIRDQDPRIAGLAGRLRERRNDLQRR